MQMHNNPPAPALPPSSSRHGGKRTTAIYVRTTTTRWSTESQVDTCSAWCERSGYRPTFVVTEPMGAASLDVRPGIQRILGLAREGMVSAAVVASLDRVARTHREVASLRGALEECGVILLTVSSEEKRDA